jgi:hypothetical protein
MEFLILNPESAKTNNMIFQGIAHLLQFFMLRGDDIFQSGKRVIFFHENMYFRDHEFQYAT